MKKPRDEKENLKKNYSQRYWQPINDTSKLYTVIKSDDKKLKKLRNKYGSFQSIPDSETLQFYPIGVVEETETKQYYDIIDKPEELKN